MRIASSNATASAGQDYALLDTTVRFAAGDAASKTVTLTVTNDTDAEADETLSVALSAPTGGASLGATTTATLTIADDDPPAAPIVTVDAAAIKQLRFSWASVTGATHYRLFQNSDGASGFTQLGADLAASRSMSMSTWRYTGLTG